MHFEVVLELGLVGACLVRFLRARIFLNSSFPSPEVIFPYPFMLKTCILTFRPFSLSFHFLDDLKHQSQIMLFSLLFILLPVHSTSLKQPFCVTTADCIEKVKKIVPDSGKFWFGDQWKTHCSGSSGARFRMVGFRRRFWEEIYFLRSQTSLLL